MQYIKFYQSLIYRVLGEVFKDMYNHYDRDAMSSLLNATDKFLNNVMKELYNIEMYSQVLHEIPIDDNSNRARYYGQFLTRIDLISDIVIAMYDKDSKDDFRKKALDCISHEFIKVCDFVYDNYKMYAYNIPFSDIIISEEEYKELVENGEVQPYEETKV